MAFITTTQFLQYADRISWIYDKCLEVFGTSSLSPVGSIYAKASEILDISVDSGDYGIEKTFNSAAKDFLDSWDVAASTSANVRQMNGLLAGLDTYFTEYGSLLSPTIADVSTFLTWYNGGDDAEATAVYDLQVSESFAAAYSVNTSNDLPSYGVFHKSYHPWIGSTYTNGMGTRAVGGSFTNGEAIPDTSAAALLLVEVTTSFSGGAAAPVVTITGIGDDEEASSTTWSVTLDSSNPGASVSTTITPAVTAMTRPTVAIGSAAGIVPGSILKVNAGLLDEEIIVVESVSGSDIVAAFSKAHNAGATLTGNRTYATTPLVAGTRCVDVTNIAITISSHSAGTVRVVNRQPRRTI